MALMAAQVLAPTVAAGRVARGALPAAPDAAAAAGAALAAAIRAYQAEATYVHVGGFAQSDWVADNLVSGGTGPGRTYVDPAMAVRQDGYIRRVVLRAVLVTGGGWRFRVFRWNAGTSEFDMVAQTPAFTPTAGTYTLTLETPLAVRMGDIPGIYLPPGAGNAERIGVSIAGASRLLPIRYAEADVTTSSALATTVDCRLDLECLAYRPYLAVSGDSLFEGHNLGAAPARWHGPLHDIADYTTQPGGVPTAEIAHQVRGLVGDGATLAYQNLALGAQTFAWVASTGVPAAVAVQPHTIAILCGVNDIDTGRTWTQVEADLDTIAGLVTTEELLICEILPWTAGTDAQAATLRTWNASLATWCAANGATLIACHDALGQARPSTGELDDLLAAYDEDGAHLTQAGVDALAAIVAAAL